MIDLDKLKTKEANGVFDTSEDYLNWFKWANSITENIYKFNEKNKLKSSSPDISEYQYIVDTCLENLESAIHVIVNDMTLNGATWLHLALLRAITGEDAAPAKHAGIYLLQLSDWYIWYAKQLGFE